MTYLENAIYAVENDIYSALDKILCIYLLNSFVNVLFKDSVYLMIFFLDVLFIYISGVLNSFTIIELL